MPVIDWIRTDLQHPWQTVPHRSTSTGCALPISTCAFCNVREPKRITPPKNWAKVAELDKTITEAEKDSLVDAIIVKTQGFVNGNIKEGDKNPVNIFRNLLALYKGIDRDALREHAVFPCRHHAGVRGVRRKYVRTSPRPTFPGTGLAAYRDQRRGHRLVPECSG